jgi:Cna protein B-type domain.
MRVPALKISELGTKALLFVLTVLISTGAVLAQAQASTADLSGTVVDPNEAVVAGASVTARNSATGITRTVTSGSDGRYQIIGLPPGDYELTAEAATFKKVAISPIKLTVGQSADLKIKMEIGAADCRCKCIGRRGRTYRIDPNDGCDHH